MLLTCISILAVDFWAFPREYVKCEKFGFSVMDIGVGSFIFIAGLISPQARNKPFVKGLISTFRSIVPLLTIGFVRIYLSRAVNYHSHVSEYGVHWNFFFTISTVSILSFLVPVWKPWLYFFLGVLIIMAYQYVLGQGLEDYILNAPRLDLFSANREGVCS